MLCSLPFLVSKRCPPSNSDYKEDYGRPVSNRSTQAEARTQLEQRLCMRTSDAPYRAMLSWQQMASFGVHQEGLDDLPQQRGTRESLLPCVVQSRACAHNITGPGGKSLSPVVAAPPHVHHAQRMLSTSLVPRPLGRGKAFFPNGLGTRLMLHQLGATKWRRSVSVSV